jgi:hypothetical protein
MTTFPKRTWQHPDTDYGKFSVVALPDGRSMILDSKGRDIASPVAEDVTDDIIEKAEAFGYVEVPNG